MLSEACAGAPEQCFDVHSRGTTCRPLSCPPHGCHGQAFFVAQCTIPSLGKLTRLFGCLGPPLSSSHSPSCFVGMLIVRFLVDLKARGRGEWRSFPSARERASALARGS